MKRLRLPAILALGAALSACAPAMAPGRCGRFDAPSMGQENGFRVTIAEDQAASLDGAPSRIDVAVASPTPLAGPITLVQSMEGREISRWELVLPPAAGIVQRCSLAYVASSCGAVLTARPQTAAGTWTILPGTNRLLEASIAFRQCAGAREAAR